MFESLRKPKKARRNTALKTFPKYTNLHWAIISENVGISVMFFLTTCMGLLILTDFTK